MSNFKLIIAYSKVSILTDSRNNTFQRTESPRILRLKMLLQEYIYTINHVKGNENCLADLLSRTDRVNYITNENKTLEYWHTKPGHPGIITLSNTPSRLDIQASKKEITEITNECIKCKLTKINNNKYGKVTGFISANSVNELVSIDILGPLKTKHFKTTFFNPYFYLFVMKDTVSRYTMVHYSFQMKTCDAIRCVKNGLKNSLSPVKYCQKGQTIYFARI